jgi:NAD+ kinase
LALNTPTPTPELNRLLDMGANSSGEKSAVNIILVAHHTRPEAADLIRSAHTWLQKHGHNLWMPPEDAKVHGLTDISSDRSAQDADLLISLGGDGTILRSVEMLNGAPVPILGVNMGTLGYLTEIEPQDFMPRLQQWLEQSAERSDPNSLSTAERSDSASIIIDERMMLSIKLTRAVDGKVSIWRALNESVIERQQSGHTVWLDVTINHELFARYSADGVIVATPTGSTAYSMSARGPVVSPRHRAMLLTPVSPHMLFDRSLVLGATEMLSMQVVGSRPAELVIDGRHVATLEHDDCVSYEGDSCTAQFVRFKQPQFHQIVRAKFGLGDE